jgi:hypothetical protein
MEDSLDYPELNIKMPTFSDLAKEKLRDEYPQLRVRGFRKSLFEFLMKILIDKKMILDPDTNTIDKKSTIELLLKKYKQGIVPDAFLLVVDERKVVVFEIEDTHMLTINKLDEYIKLYSNLQELKVELGLIFTDRYGQSRRYLDLNMYEWYFIKYTRGKLKKIEEEKNKQKRKKRKAKRITNKLPPT